MNKIKRKNEGITLITLAIAVVILVIISSLLVYNAKTGIKLRNLDMMYNDIELLSDKVNSYYTKYGALPASIEYIEDIAFQPEPNDSTIYYVIDLNALDGISLNYGYGFKNITSEEDTLGNNDVYIINEDSHHIYYAKGIEMDGTVYYTNESDDEVVIIEGSYLVNGTTYYKTLQEAVDSAEEGSTIKVIRGASEPDGATINKEIVLDTNGKTINLNRVIHIDTDKDVIIKGNGIIQNQQGSAINIYEVGNLQIKDIVISSNSINGGNSIVTDNESGTITIDNSKIDVIRTNVSSKNTYININSGTIGEIYMYYNTAGANYLQINGGTINKINYGFNQYNGGKLQIYGGEIDEITIEDPIGFASDGVIVGNPNEVVSKTNPYIHNIIDGGCVNELIIQFNSGAIVNNGVISFVPRSGYTVTTEYNNEKKENIYVLTK